MKKELAAAHKIVLVFCLLAFFGGCGDDSSAPPPKASKSIRKKIAVRPPDPVKKDTDLTASAKPEAGKRVDSTPEPDRKTGVETEQTSEPAKITASAGVSSESKGGELVEEDAKIKPRLPESAKTEGSSGIESKSEPEEPEQAAVKGGENSSDQKKTDGETPSKPVGASEKYVAYNSDGIIDPFIPLFRTEPKKKTPPEETKTKTIEKKKPEPPPRRLTPLEKLDLSQLKLVGIIWAKTGSKALVEEASGKGYIITRGTFIGINSGRVVDIQEDRIVVEEKEKDILGDVIVRKRELKFQRPSGDGLL